MEALACKHCGRRIWSTNWYHGPGWIHDQGGHACEPTTYAEPEVD